MVFESLPSLVACFFDGSKENERERERERETVKIVKPRVVAHLAA
jgi:hypothetical protein